MNNLKRVLSLALSGIMLVGMMAMGASAADFTDAEDIQHDEAVNILVALNVINGQDDGSFNPKGDVTRGQMAKMIAVAMQGGNNVSLGTKTTPSFTDIKGHWAESFIEYCADLGIISGRGDGTFDPDGKVTGMEATKMVLSALGYNAEAYKLTGAAWAVNTDELARKTEVPLYEELGSDVVLNAAATRDTAAQLIWNGLQSVTRKVTPEKNTNTGEVTWGYGTGKQMLKERYNADILTGTYVGNYKTGAAEEEGQVAIRYDGTDYSVPSELGIENIGEEVKVIYKDGKNGGDGPDKWDTIYGVFNTGKTRVINTTRNDIKKVADQPDNSAKLKIGSTEYTVAAFDSNATVIEINYDSNQRTSTSGANKEARQATARNLFAGLHVDQDGDTVKFVCDKDGKIAMAYVVETKIAAVTALNSTKITLNNGVGTVTIADGDVEDGLKKGDVVTATVLYKGAANKDGAYVIVKKAETVTGTVNGYKNTDNVTVDSKAYKIYQKASLLNPIPDEDDVITSFNTGDNTYIGEDVTLYMVNGYVGAAVQNSEAATNYSLVTEVKGTSTSGSTFSGLQLQVMNGEGVKTIITVSEDSKDVRKSVGDGTGTTTSTAGTDFGTTEIADAGASYKKVIDSSDYKVGDIITYTLDKNNEADVTVENKIDITSSAKYSSDDTKFNNTPTTADCVVFVQTKELGDMDATDSILFEGATYKAYKIRDLKGFGGTGVATHKGMTTVYNRDNKVVAAFVNLGGGKDPSGATTNTVYGIVSAANGRVKDYYTYEVQSNGETYTVNSKDNFAKGSLVFFDKTSDDNYAAGDVKVLNANYNANSIYAAPVYTKDLEGMKALTFYKSTTGVAGNLVGRGQTTYQLDSDAKIVYVDQDNDESAAEGSVGTFDSVTGYMNALIVYEYSNNDVNSNTQNILAIFVETSNECNVINNAAKLVSGTLDASAKLALGDGTFLHTTSSYDEVDSILVNITNGTAGSATLTVYENNKDGASKGTSTKTLVADVRNTFEVTGINGWAAGTYYYEVKLGTDTLTSGTFVK